MKRLHITIAALVLSVFASTASAVPVLSFDDDGSSQDGTLSYDGNGGALIGSGIDFVSLLATDTPSNNGTILSCIGCELNFTTGNNISEGPLAWTFAGGGSLTITGTLTDGGGFSTSGTLVSGSFSQVGVLGINNTIVMTGLGVDTKDTDLLDFFGLSDSVFEFASTNISLANAVIGPNGGFFGTVTNADFDNTVPEPAISALVGLGLLGVGLARRRRA